MFSLKKMAVATACATAVLGTAAIASADGFNAYLAVQTDVYTFRNTWDDESYGLNGTMIGAGATDEKNAALVDYDYLSTGLIYWADNVAAISPCDIENALDITENGIYKVGISNIEWPAGDSGFNFLFLSTDFPVAEDADSYEAYISELKVYVDGQEVYYINANSDDYQKLDTEGVLVDYQGLGLNEKDDSLTYICYTLYNIYGDGAADMTSLQMGSSYEVEFVVQGINGEVDDTLTLGDGTDAEAEDDTDAEAEDDTDAAEEESAADDTDAADESEDTAAASTAADDTEEESSSNTGVVVGIIVAIAAVIAIIVAVAKKGGKKDGKTEA